MPTITEGKLTFTFPDEWNVSKYDDWGHYRNQFIKVCGGVKAVDVLALEPQGKDARVAVRSARGGHPRAVAELKLYQKSVLKRIGGETLPDLLVVAIDGNCSSFASAHLLAMGPSTPRFVDRSHCRRPRSPPTMLTWARP